MLGAPHPRISATWRERVCRARRRPQFRNEWGQGGQPGKSASLPQQAVYICDEQGDWYEVSYSDSKGPCGLPVASNGMPVETASGVPPISDPVRLQLRP